MLQLFLSKPYVSVYFFVHIFSQPCFYFVSLYFLLTYTMKVLKLLYCFVTFPFSSQLRQVASVPLIFNGITTTFSKVLYFIQFIEPIYKNLSTRSLRWLAVQLLLFPPPFLLACHELFWFTVTSGTFLSTF